MPVRSSATILPAWLDDDAETARRLNRRGPLDVEVWPRAIVVAQLCAALMRPMPLADALRAAATGCQIVAALAAALPPLAPDERVRYVAWPLVTVPLERWGFSAQAWHGEMAACARTLAALFDGDTPPPAGVVAAWIAHVHGRLHAYRFGARATRAADLAAH